jgi:hypothetical protein
MFTVNIDADFSVGGMIPCNITDLLSCNVLNSCTGGIRFESLTEHRLSCPMFLVVSFSCSKKLSG